MANKIYSVYNNNGDYSAKDGDQLIVETGNTHFACIAKNGDKNIITAFEWFKHDKDETKNYEGLITNIKAGSKLLDKYYSQTNVFINNEYSVLVPHEKFDKQIADDYLDVVHGKLFNCTTLFNDIKDHNEYVNAYRVPNQVLEVLNQHLVMVKFEHTYTQLIKQILALKNLPNEFVNVHFYNSNIIVAIFRNSKLQFIQSFVYQSAEDVLYYLLSISQKVNLQIEHAIMKVSGMIETHSALYGQLTKYFRNVSFETVETGRLKVNTDEHPSHYFTPFFNLAL